MMATMIFSQLFTNSQHVNKTALWELPNTNNILPENYQLVWTTKLELNMILFEWVAMHTLKKTIEFLFFWGKVSPSMNNISTYNIQMWFKTHSLSSIFVQNLELPKMGNFIEASVSQFLPLLQWLLHKESMWKSDSLQWIGSHQSLYHFTTA